MIGSKHGCHIIQSSLYKIYARVKKVDPCFCLSQKEFASRFVVWSRDMLLSCWSIRLISKLLDL